MYYCSSRSWPYVKNIFKPPLRIQLSNYYLTQRAKTKTMTTDFSHINSEQDLDQATRDISERINYNRQQIKEESRELPRSVARAAIRNSAPWVLGAVTGLAATLLIRKMVRRSKRVPVSIPAISSVSKTPAGGKIASAVALQLLPIAGILLKNWISRRKTNAAVNH